MGIHWYCSSPFWRFIVLTLVVTTFQRPSLHFAQGTPIEIKAVEKGSAFLPCNISSPLPDDSVLLVVWYKNDKNPIYSYDQRGKNAEKASHWRDEKVLSDRAYFRTMSEPAALSLDNVMESDDAEYRCRVDFKKSPTRNHKVKLTVIVPPGQPSILNDKNQEVVEAAGPFEEGAEMRLTCLVHGGKPPPDVKWWLNGNIVETFDTGASSNTKHNQLVVRHLSRKDLHSVYTCIASNNNISQPVSAKILVEMHFKPMSAQILSSFQPLSVDRKFNITCQAIGSRPSARISWWIDGRRLEHFSEKVSEDGNVTTSMIKFTPTLKDHEKTLICRAENPRVKSGVEEDVWRLDVMFLPVLKLELGSKMNPDDIEEGDDVYFECKVQANPAAYKVLWKHNGHTVQHNQKAGVIVSSKALALQSVKRHQAGNYTCIASNVEGDGESNTVQLRVMYKPICRSDQKRVYGVARNENAHILCEVDSFPPPDDFKWTFNNSAETIEVSPNRYHSTPPHSVSTLSYVPLTDLDYGTIMCWASNTAGQQPEPCVFLVISAGRPDSPYNCTLMNQTTESLELECLEGFDGGQSQQFQLEVYHLPSNQLLENKTSQRLPLFVVNNLAPGLLLKLVVYATNSKGRSDPIVIEGFTLKAAEKQTGTPVPFELTPFIGVLIIVGTLLLVSAIVIIGALKRSQKRGAVPRPQALPIKDKAALPLRSHVQDLYDMDDKNPDLIPCNKDSEYQLGTPGQGQVVSNEGQPVVAASPSYQDTIPRNNVISRNGDIYDNYKNRYTQQQQQQPLQQGEEVTYAELCLARPTSLGTGTEGNIGTGPGGGVIHRNEPTVYAEIDHTRRPPLISPGTHREIVTVRTPLMANAQESCV